MFYSIADRRERGRELLEYLTFEATDSVHHSLVHVTLDLGYF